ncbi:TetR/AcrR family transcriptional regulator [Duganella callida]|uniref:TetR/AcrR family transcriptional regulator n=1 Tax=Duganella callida TaxID=2561932 RepID=UPI0014309521|nr:TetR family transcriptional regulator [Duganella callida]
MKNKNEPLDRDRIARAALALIDEQGIDQLSMRKLGSMLGVEAMALYHHFRNKAELLDGILDIVLEEVSARLTPDGTPLERVRRTFDGLRGISIEHPHAFLSMVSRRFRTPVSLQFYERLLQLFHEAGLTPEQSARYYRMMANFTTGAGLTEVGSRARQPDATPVILEDFNRPGEFPRITAAMPYLRVTEIGGIYQAGMDLLFAALQAELHSRR